VTTPQQSAEIGAGSEARNVLQSRGWLNARAAILDGLAQQRQTVAVTNTLLHSKLILAEQMFFAIEQHLRDAAQTGEWAQMQIADEKQREQSALDRVSGWLRRA